MRPAPCKLGDRDGNVAGSGPPGPDGALFEAKMRLHGKSRCDAHNAAFRPLGMLLVLLAATVSCAVSLIVYLHFDQGLF